MPFAALDHRFSELLQGGLWRCERIVALDDLVFKGHFRIVSAWTEWIKRVGKAIIEDGQGRD